MIIAGKRIKGLQAYKVKRKKEWLYVWECTRYVTDHGLMFDAYTTLCEGQELPNCHSSASAAYLSEFCTPQSYAKLPDYVQDHLREYVIY